MSSMATPTLTPTTTLSPPRNTSESFGQVFFITLLVTLVACIWILYLAFYNARVFGFLLTKIINKFIKQGHLKIGSFSFSVLSGKVMFYDVAYLTEDCTIRAQHGLLIFRWWRPYTPLGGQEDTSQCETRLTVFLSSCEVHLYNRTSLYAQLEKAFGLPPEMVSRRESETRESTDTDGRNELQRRHDAAGISWRDFFGVIKFEVTDGRFVFGNKLVPSVLMLRIDDCHGSYTTREPECRWDRFTHEVKCTAEQLKVVLAPSPKYEGPIDEPPRYMGEVGFVVMQSSKAQIHYYQDEPGLVPTEEELLEEDDDEYQPSNPPVSVLDITCQKKGTHFTYGPWADRQREFLMKFFYPQQYNTHPATPPAVPGDKRQFETLDITLNIVEEATLDILFTKNKETNAFHIHMRRGSYVEICIPQLIGIEGYNTKIVGQLLLLDADTSLPYRSFIKSETLEFKVDVHYPRAWNHPQNWEVSLTFSKADWFFIYAHKIFLTDLMSDWSSKGRQDLFNFVPYTVRLNITLHQFELMLPVNEYNWVDCSSHDEENVCIGLVGEQLEMSIVLPFTDYLPQTVPIRILIKADAVSGYLFLPDCYTSQHLFTTLDKASKASSSYLENKKSMGLDRSYWRHNTDDPKWIECACVPVVALCILYTYHPCPLDEDVPRIVVKQGPRGKQHWSSVPPQTSYGGWRRGESMVDPGALSADSLQLEVDIGPLLVMTYGPLIKMIPSLKEDFLGLNQDIVDFMSPLNRKERDKKEEPTKYADSRVLNPMALRPFNITVSLNIDGIKGFLPKYCSKADVGCATLVMEQLCFEMCREFTQTKLQLLLSPILLMVTNSPTQDTTPPSNQPERGQMALSGLQLRCHAMFSRAGIPPDSETVEYAWLIDLQMGALSGQLTVPQLLAIAESLSLTLPLVTDPVDKLAKPARPQMCVHMVDSERCAAREGGIYPSPCPSEDDLKYRVVRVAVNAVQLQLVENTAALEIKVNQIRLATCNLHSETVESGLTALINHIDIHQYLLQSDHPSFRTPSRRPLRSEPLQNWLEVGAINLGPVCIDCVGFLQEVSDYRMQHYFLMMHDESTKRLWFLWPPDSMDRVYPSSVKCGCQGGCAFFSDKPYGTHFFKVGNGTHSQRNSWNDEFQQKESDYGRSLLQEGKWVFSVCDRTPADSPTKAFKFTPGWVGLASPTSPGDQFWANEEKAGAESEQPVEAKKEQSQSESSQQSSTVGILRRESQRSQQSHVSQQSDSVGSAVRSSVCSDPTSHQHFDSSSTISSNPAPGDSQLVGSSHSLPVDSQQQQSQAPTPPQNYSSDTIPKTNKAMHFEQIPPKLDRTRASSIDSPTSGADSEYFSAGEDPSLTAAIHTSTSSTSIPSTVHPPTDSGSSLSEFKVQSTISSSDHQSPENMESATSTESFVSAASSEDTLIRMQDEQDATMKRKDSENHSPYSPFLTRVTSHRWSVPLSLESWKQYVNFDPVDMTPSTSSLYQASIQMMGFVKKQQGVSPEIITAVDSDVTSSDSEGVSDHSSVRYASDHRDASLQDLHERLFVEPSHTTSSAIKLEPSSGTSVFAEIQGPVNVLMTPLLLVAINRYVDAAKTITTSQHPAALLSSLHHSCIADVESLFLRGLLPEGGSSSSLTRQQQQQQASSNFNNNADPEEREDSIKTVTMTVKLPKVNLCVLQVPEDGVGVPSLTSNNASLLIAQLGSSEANLWIKQINRSIKVESQSGSDKKVPQDTQAAVAMGAAEQSDPTVVTLIKFFKLHAQLRRLAKPGIKTIESPTAIPEQYTQVQFTLSSKVPPSSSADEADSRYASLPRKRRLSVHMPKSWIMAESGMEEISIKLGRQGGDIPLPKIKFAGDGKKSEKRTDKKDSGSASKKRTDSTSSAREGSGKRKRRDRFSSGGSSLEKPSDTKERGLDLCIHISSFWSHLPTPPQPKKESFVQGTDTNLLTTASPALDEWLRAMSGLTTSAGDIMDARHFRSCAIMACIMAEAHDDLDNHQPLPKKKQTRWAAISDAMLKDLSCQLMGILWRYLASADWQKIEDIVSGEDLPALSSLESGTNTLIRQWKVTLSLINPQINVARFPQQVTVYKSPEERGLVMDDETWSPRQISEDPMSDVPPSTAHTGDSELMDPLTLSLYSDRIGVGLQKSIYAEFSGKVQPSGTDWLKELSNRQRERSGDTATRYRSLTNTSTAGSASGTSAKKWKGGYKTLDEEDKHDTFSPSSSLCSDEITDNLDKSNPRLIDDDEELDGCSPVGNLDIDLESGTAFQIPGASEGQKSPVLTPTVQKFGDADTLFRPLLSNLGLHKKNSSQPLAKLIQSVGQVSFQFKLDQFRVVITKSSSKHLRRHSQHAESSRAPRSADTPAFLCEKIHIRAMVRETVPSEKSESLFKATSTTFFSGSSSIEICCDIHVGSVVQVVNMAILRLLSQVIQMVENFQHAKTDLKLKQYVSSMPQGEGSVADLRVRAANSRHTRNPSHRSNKVFTPPNVDTLGRTRQSSQRSRNLKFKEQETASLYSTAESFDSHAESDSIPKCWQTMYHLINLYSGVNEPVNVATTHVFVNPLFSAKGNERGGGMMEGVADLGLGMPQDRDTLALGGLEDLDGNTEEATQPRPDIEGLEVSLIGTILVDEVCLLAQLAGLHLEADTTYITGSFSLQQTLPMQGYVPAALWRKFPSIGASLQTTAVTLELSEKAKKDFYTIASLTIDKPQSTVSLSGSLDHQNQVSLATGVDMVNLTVPMNLSVLSAVVSRSSKKLAQRIHQLKQTQKSYRSTQEEVVIAAAPSKPSLTGSKMDETWPPDRAEARWTLNGVTRVKTVVLQASVLPQLQAQYTIDGTSGTASWGEEGTFAADITEHSFKFISTVPAEFGAPAKITFPGIHVKGRYGLYDAQNESSSTTTTTASSRQGSNNILEAVTEIQAFQHTLSPDLVNHLITVQKVILKELNNMVRGIQQTHWPVSESSKTKLPPSTPTVERLTYSMQLRLEGIQVTATSPTASAVRFETGVVELELSNRPHTETDSGEEEVNPGHGMRMFAKALIEFNLSLGTLVKNPVFIEAEPEFHEMAYFKTKIGLRNTVKDINDDLTEGKDTLLITLNRPTLFVQSSAADRAVLLWLSYTSSYDQWVEQWKTMAQDDNVQGVVQDAPRLPLIRNQEGADSTLFLQLTVQELGICIPILPSVQNLGVSGTRADIDCHSALVLTLESSLISACYSNSLATKGSFHTICLRFTEDFQMAMDDWRPSSYDHIMNSCVIPQGTYEVCSSANSNQAKDFHRVTIGQWRLNFKWRMEGIDVQFDPSIGHQLTALANTLTSLTGADDDIADLTSVTEQQEVSSNDVLSDQEVTPLKRPTSLKVDRNDDRRKSKAIMQEINEQAKVVSDLRTLGAKSGTIAEEADKLRQMETAVFKDFRRDIRKKLKAQGMKVSGRDKSSRRKSTKPQGAPLIRSQKERHASYVRQSTFPMTPYDKDYQHHQSSLYDTPSSMKTPKTARSTLYPDPPSRVSFVLPLHTPSPTTPEASPMGWTTDVRQGPMSRLGLGMDSGLTPLDLNSTIGDPTRIQEEIRQSRKSIRRRLTLHSTPMTSNLDGSDTEEEEEEEEEEEKERYSGQSAMDDADGSHSSTLLGKDGTAPSTVLSRSSAARDRTSNATSPARSVAPEPELQLHLDVSIFIDSGKLTLHCHRPGPPAAPNDHLLPDALKQESRRPWNSTESSPSRKPGVKSQLSSASSSSTSGMKLKGSTLPLMLSSQGFALFNLPAVDVKVEYQSEPDNKQDTNTDTASTSMQSSPRLSTTEGAVEKKNGARRGCLFCWARLLTPAEEIVVTTSLLDFLEQALETIPSNIGMMLTSPSSENLDANPPNLEASANSLVSSSSLDYTTFPVDVVVYVCMDPSLVHLSCLPASKVECLLQLPCVEFAFSSRGGQQTSGFSGDTTGGDRSGADFQDARDDLTASRLSFSRCRSRHLSGEEIREEANKADMSLSAVLSNFSLVIFHPYGGSQFRRDGGKLVEEMFSNMSLSGDTHDDTSKLSSGSTRKDALSLEVTFVRVNVSRKRHKLRPTVAGDQTVVAGAEESRRLGESLRSDSTSLSSATITGSKNAATLNKFSIMCDVGSATFRYDMRRLTEVLAFPKAWYRKSIVQRLFFGEEEQEDEMSTPEDEATSTILSSDTSTDSEDSFTDLPPRRYQRKRTPTSTASSVTGTPSSTAPSASATDDPSPTSPGSKGSREKFPYNPPSPSLFSIYSQLPSPSSPTLSQSGTPLMGGTPPPRSSPDLRRMVTEKRLSKEETTSQSSEPSGSEHSHSQATCSSSGSLVSGPSWKTVLLLAINFTKVDTHMNMSNVMGSTLWSTEDLRCQTHLTIDSTGHRIFKITTGLKNSSLEAKGGVIGGLLEVSKLSCTSSQVKIPGKEPHHDLQLQLESLESRIDYMGSSSLLARLTLMEIACEDEWKFRANSDPKVKYHTVESVHANSVITWDILQLMICRSTTPDMLRIAVRLEEFFTQQFASSRRMLSSLDPIATAASHLAAARKASISTAPIDEIDGSGHKGSKTDAAEEPKEHQHWQSVFDFLIQTFHKAHKNQPRPEGMRLGGQVTLQGRQALLACFHGLNFRSNSWALFTMREPKVEFETEALQVPSSEHCGEDTLVLQDLLFSLGHNQTQREQGWLATILRVSKNDKSHFPFTGSMLEAFQYVSSISTPEEFEQYFQYGDLPSQRRGTLRHEADPIFALPKLQLEMKSKQLQKLKNQRPGIPSSIPPEVQVTFVTLFTDHINVSMDFELILFLHDMVLAYINYKQKVMAPMKPMASSPPTSSQIPSTTSKKIATLKSATLQTTAPSQRPSSSLLSSSSSSSSPSSTTSSTPTESVEGKKRKEKKGGTGNVAKAGNSDCRLFVCSTWQLEPTIRLLSWGGKQIEPVGVDYILQKLGFRHARTTIPKWIQRGAMDPADKLLSLLAKNLLMIILEREKSDAEKRQKDKALPAKGSSKPAFPGT
ncbi:transmembrane protein KIAA1109-like isoform X2 [Lytechinus variegatus]|uniref:transmembrane protein KIAA1109-like isoform X2 n=1 Tax=Lytechinus variegatus TaxID=7654 RepID=UPI001BB10716|nr:transmembrane protein KIAA1109-like isoform X2 [Lytechinus variegatus]